MAGVFTFVYVVVGTWLVLAARGYVRFGRRRSWLRNPFLPVMLAAILLSAYLVTKFAYEEIYPCVAVDDFYCDFGSTQYHNLFGWEF